MKEASDDDDMTINYKSVISVPTGASLKIITFTIADYNFIDYSNKDYKINGAG